MKLKDHVLIVVKTDIPGSVQTVRSHPRPNSLGVELPVRKRPRALWQETYPEPVLIP